MKLPLLTVAALLAVTLPAGAQSLFGQPAANEPALADDGAAPAAPRPKPKPKPRGPVPARALTINNASSATIASIEISGEGKTARLAKPLPSQSKATLRLPAFKKCTVSVVTTFEGMPAEDQTEQNICRDKSLRFTE